MHERISDGLESQNNLTEEDRLAALHGLGLLDSNSEERFDRLTALAAALFDTPIALVTLLDAERQWFKSNIGLDVSETPRQFAFCHHAVAQSADRVFVVQDAANDPRFADNPLVLGPPNIRFYAGAVIAIDGAPLGTLCVIDDKPRANPGPATLRQLQLLASLVSQELQRTREIAQARERERLLELTETISGVGHWRVEAQTFRVTWSDQVYAIHGVNRETFDPNYGEAVEFYHPDDRARVDELVRRAFETGEGFDFKLRLYRHDGQMRNVACRAKCKKGPSGKITALIGVFQDITEHFEQQEAIRESETRFRLLAENTNDLVTQLDRDGLVRFLSPACVRVTGYQPEEVIGRSVMKFIHPDDRAKVRDAFEQAIAGGGSGGWRIEYRLRHKSGADLWIEARPTRILNDEGVLVGVTDVLRDVTARKEAEAALIEARNEAERLARVKGEFLATMSHELRTPLNSIIGFTGIVARRADLAADVRRQIGIILQSSYALRKIVDNVLDLSALESGRVTLEIAPFSVIELVDEVVDAFHFEAHAKGLALYVKNNLDTVALVRLGDRSRIRQVLTNLVGNAVKFTQSGYVQIELTQTSGHEHSLRVDVFDSGIGVSAVALPLLFTRFGQEHVSTRRRFGGAGLGLSICKALIDQMGGQVGATSVLGRGARFWFEAPLPIAHLPAKSAPSPQLSEAPRILPGLRVLVVDDVDLNLELCEELLKSLGCEVTAATNAQEGVERVRRNAFDLVFMDVQMPHMDGQEATRLIRAEPGFEHLPIIALTAQALPHQVRACLESGMNDYVAKPIEIEDLMRVLTQWGPGRIQSRKANSHDPWPAVDFTALRPRFVERTRNDLDRIRGALSDATPKIQMLGDIVHRMAGAAGTLGFPAIGEAALHLDQSIASGKAPTDQDWLTFCAMAEQALDATND